MPNYEVGAALPQGIERHVEMSEYDKFLEDTGQATWEWIQADNANRATITGNISEFCNLVEAFAGVIDREKAKNQEKYTSLQKSINERNAKALKKLKEMEESWPENDPYTSGTRARSRAVCIMDDLRREAEWTIDQELSNNGPPVDGYIWASDLFSFHIKCPISSTWIPPTINPMLWLPIGHLKSKEPEHENQRLLRDSVLLAVIHDNTVEGECPIFRNEHYDGKYFDRDKCFVDLLILIRKDDSHMHLIERAVKRVTSVADSRNAHQGKGNGQGRKPMPNRREAIDKLEKFLEDSVWLSNAPTGTKKEYWKWISHKINFPVTSDNLTETYRLLQSYLNPKQSERFKKIRLAIEKNYRK